MHDEYFAVMNYGSYCDVFVVCLVLKRTTSHGYVNVD